MQPNRFQLKGSIQKILKYGNYKTQPYSATCIIYVLCAPSYYMPSTGVSSLLYLFHQPPPPADCMHHFPSSMISCASQPGPTLHLLLLLACLLMCIYVRCLCYGALLSPLLCICCFPVQYYSSLNISCVLFQTTFPHLPFSKYALTAIQICDNCLLFSKNFLSELKPIFWCALSMSLIQGVYSTLRIFLTVKTSCVILQVLKTMLIKILIFWDMMPFNTISILRENIHMLLKMYSYKEFWSIILFFSIVYPVSNVHTLGAFISYAQYCCFIY